MARIITDELLRSPLRGLPWVREQTRLGRSTIYKKIAAGEFPEQVNLGGNMVAWPEMEVLEWKRQILMGQAASK